MAAPRTTDQSRLEAAALLAQLQSLRASMEEAAGRAAGSATHSELASSLSEITGIETTLAQALQAGSTLATIDFSAIARLIQGSQTTLSAAEAARGTDAGGAASALAAASAATRQEVQTLSHDLFERRIFDPYLRFA